MTVQAARAAAKRRSRNVALTALRVSRPRPLRADGAANGAHLGRRAVLARCHYAGVAHGRDLREDARRDRHKHRGGASERRYARAAQAPRDVQRGWTPSGLAGLDLYQVAAQHRHADDCRLQGRFYSEVRPLLEIEAPICYYSTYDRETLPRSTSSRISSRPNPLPFAATRLTSHARWQRT